MRLFPAPRIERQFALHLGSCGLKTESFIPLLLGNDDLCGFVAARTVFVASFSRKVELFSLQCARWMEYILGNSMEMLHLFQCFDEKCLPVMLGNCFAVT